MARKGFVCLLALVVVFSAFVFPVHAYPMEAYVSLTAQHQENSNASYFEIARDAFRTAAGDSVAPVLMEYGEQYFMVLVKDGHESVLPVPYDETSAGIVASGNGFVDPSSVIDAIKEQQKNVDPNVKLGGDSFMNVWQMEPNATPDSTAIIVFIIVVAALAWLGIFIGYLSLWHRGRIYSVPKENPSKQEEP